MITLANLQNTESPISRAERNKLNGNWEAILENFRHLQRQINILAGTDVEALIKTITDTIDHANQTVMDLIDETTEVTDQKVAEVNAALDNLSTLLSSALQQMETARIEANNAATNANNKANLAQTAADDANTATANANSATQNTNEAISKAETATNQANNARDNANSAASAANDAAVSANTAKDNAVTATSDAIEATENANVATSQAIEATGATVTATSEANSARDDALQAAQSVIDAIETMQADIQATKDAFAHKGEYSASVQYYKDNEVSFNGSTYRAVKDTQGNAPTPLANNEYWLVVARRGVDGSGAVHSINNQVGDVVLEPSTIGAASEMDLAKLSDTVGKVDERLTIQLQQIAVLVNDFPILLPELDDTARINRAINYAATYGNGNVLLPPKTLTISSDIILKSNISLIGSNKYLSIIKSTANNSMIAIHDVSNVTLENFTFDANYKASRIAVQAINASISNVTLNNLIVKNSGMKEDRATWSNNIQVKRWGEYSVKDVWLTNLYCEHAAGDGRGHGDNIIIESYGSDGPGLFENIIIDKCILRKAARQNISVAGDMASNRPDFVTISNSICIDSTMAGLDLEEGNKVSVSNVHFINSGKYEGFYNNGSHYVEAYPNTIMRSGVSLHGDNNSLVTNCTFTNCHYGLGGHGTGLHVSNSKFFDSIVSNGDLSAAGKWRLSNCEFAGSGVTTHLVYTHLGRVFFDGCTFRGKTSSGYMVRLTGESSAETHYRESGFDACDFIGPSDRSMNVFYISYGTYKFNNCTFNDFDKVFNCYQSSGRARIFVTGGNIRKVNRIVESGYVSIDKLVIKSIVAEKIKQIAKFNLRQYYVSIDGCEFYLDINTEDVTGHLGIDVPLNGGIQNFRFKDNFIVNEGTATDVIGIRATVRSQEILTDIISISGNEFKNLNVCYSIPLYTNSTKATTALITHNQSVNSTTLQGDIAGVNTVNAIIEKNIHNGTVV